MLHQSWSGDNSIMNTGLVKVLKSASAQQTYTCRFFHSEFSKLILHRNTLFFFSFKNELKEMENPLRIAVLFPRVTLGRWGVTLRDWTLAGGGVGVCSPWRCSIRPTRRPSPCSSAVLPEWTHQHVRSSHTLYSERKVQTQNSLSLEEALLVCHCCIFNLVLDFSLSWQRKKVTVEEG